MNNRIVIYIAVMALVTYGVRVLPHILFRKKIENPMIQDFLKYVPYAVLSAMTIPDIFSSTGNVLTAAAGFGTAFLLSLKEKSLIIVALSACAAAFVMEMILSAMNII